MEKSAEVEEQVVRLGRDVLPMLSSGYGTSVGLVGSGTTLIALGWFLFCYETIFVNGAWVGIHHDPDTLVKTLRVIRLGRKIDRLSSSKMR